MKRERERERERDGGGGYAKMCIEHFFIPTNFYFCLFINLRQ